VIRIVRADLPSEVSANLAVKAAKLGEDPKAARKLWKGADGLRKVLKSELALMAAGRGYCMYCGDGMGSDIDHHEPIAHNPARTFDWLNHLLACAFCNSHHKREQYPLDEQGLPLLIDPTFEDPLDHLFLALSVGKYRALTIKGEQTIQVCGLNRASLERGRQNAFDQVCGLVTRWWEMRESGDSHAEARAIWTLCDQPHGDVLHAMLRQAELPGARDIFRGDDRLIARLRLPDLRSAVKARMADHRDVSLGGRG